MYLIFLSTKQTSEQKNKNKNKKQKQKQKQKKRKGAYIKFSRAEATLHTIIDGRSTHSALKVNQNKSKKQ